MTAFNYILLGFVLFGYAVGPLLAVLLVIRINRAETKKLRDSSQLPFTAGSHLGSSHLATEPQKTQRRVEGAKKLPSKTVK